MPVTLIHVQVEGMQRLKSRLKDDYARELRRRTSIALVKVGRFIMEKSDEVVPIDTGDLWNSHFIRLVDSGVVLMVKIGYDDWKAAIVHEDVTKLHGDAFNAAYAAEIAAGLEHARRPEEKARFLHDAIHDNLPEIRKVFRANFK